MTRTKNQQMADAHEVNIAEWIGGRQTKGSGNQWHAQLDAKNGINKVPFPIGADGKATLGKSVGVSREMWRKAEEQSFGEIPALFLRFYRDENLRTVDQDLVVLSVDDFKRMLDAARAHRRQQEANEALEKGFLEALNSSDGDVQIPNEILAPELLEQHGHEYTSTACGHAQLGGGATYLHARCRKTCKFCGTHCNCGCHNGATE